MLGYALSPSTLARLGLTGKTVPPKGLVTRFQRIVRPTLPAFSVAPMTATLLGAKNTSKGRPSARTMSCDRLAERGSVTFIKQNSSKRAEACLNVIYTILRNLCRFLFFAIALSVSREIRFSRREETPVRTTQGNAFGLRSRT